MIERMTASAISLKDLEQRFSNGVQALAGISTEVAAGEFVALLGPSGCGKSTVLRLVAGLDKPSSGHVILKPGAPGENTAFVFQDPTLLPWASVFDNVYLPLRIKGMVRHEARARIETLLATVGLREFASQRPATLSGGMRMRVSIARALVTDPAVLLMDEPFAALDEITRLKLNRDLLAWWEARRMTVLFVTHSVQEAVMLAERVIVLGARPGRVVDELRLPTPHPRPADFRTSPAFHEACRSLSEALERTQQDRPA
jgi:NitT/TauT family transport system ATP-binding protein